MAMNYNPLNNEKNMNSYCHINRREGKALAFYNANKHGRNKGVRKLSMQINPSQ